MSSKTGRRLVIAIGLALALAACGEDAAPPPKTHVRGEPVRSVDFYIKRAHRVYARGLYEGALIDLDHALELEPGDAGALALRGLVRYELALKPGESRNPATWVPKDDAAPIRPSCLRWTDEDRRDGNSEGALESGSPLARGLAATFAWERSGEAELSFHYDLQIRSSGELRSDRGALVAALRAGLERAEATFTEAMGDASIRARAANGRGIARFRAGRHADALSDFRTACDLAPRNAAFLDNRGLAEERVGDGAAAVASHRAAIEVDSGPLLRYLERVEVREETFALPRREDDEAADAERFAPALVDLGAAIGANPGLINAREGRALIRLRTIQLTDAIEDLDFVLDREPTRSRSRFFRAWCRALRAQIDGREAEQRRAKADILALIDADSRYALVLHASSFLEVPTVDDVLMALTETGR